MSYPRELRLDIVLRKCAKNSLRIHRPLVMMGACTRVRVLCEKGKPVARRGRKA
jgi:hypothetical protein